MGHPLLVDAFVAGDNAGIAEDATEPIADGIVVKRRVFRDRERPSSHGIGYHGLGRRRQAGERCPRMGLGTPISLATRGYQGIGQCAWDWVPRTRTVLRISLETRGRSKQAEHGGLFSTVNVFPPEWLLSIRSLWLCGACLVTWT